MSPPDQETGEASVETVTSEIIGKGTKHPVKISIDVRPGDGDDAAAETLTATDGHPFWVEGSDEWTEATDLKRGDWLRTGAGTLVQVTAVERWTQQATVHNLTITDLHTYYVLAGATPVLVHNAGGGAKDPLRFGSGYTGRLDRINIGGRADFEVHVYHRGKEVGIFGSNGWFPKHGKSADVSVPGDVYNNLKGLAVGEMRAAGRIGKKGTEKIKGDSWKRPRITGGC